MILSNLALLIVSASALIVENPNMGEDCSVCPKPWHNHEHHHNHVKPCKDEHFEHEHDRKWDDYCHKPDMWWCEKESRWRKHEREDMWCDPKGLWHRKDHNDDCWYKKPCEKPCEKVCEKKIVCSTSNPCSSSSYVCPSSKACSSSQVAPTSTVAPSSSVAPTSAVAPTSEKVLSTSCPPCTTITTQVPAPLRCNTVVICNPVLSNCPKPTGTITLTVKSESTSA